MLKQVLAFFLIVFVFASVGLAHAGHEAAAGATGGGRFVPEPYASMPDPLDCVGIFSVGTDGKYYWHGCSSNACQPTYGDCTKKVDDNGKWYCDCQDDSAANPLCEVHAKVNTTTGLVGGFNCLNHGCDAGCDEYENPPLSLFYPCAC
jgi:hypothetical protein